VNCLARRQQVWAESGKSQPEDKPGWDFFMKNYYPSFSGMGVITHDAGLPDRKESFFMIIFGEITRK